MPGKRRRSAITSPTFRTRMWDLKMRGDIYPEILERTKPLGLEKMQFYQSAYQHVLDTVREILASHAVETHLLQEYMWYALALWRLTQRYRGPAIIKEGTGIYLRYFWLGRNEHVLRDIAEAMAIQIPEWDEISWQIHWLDLIALPQTHEITIPAYTDANSIFEIEIQPPFGYGLALDRFKISTPAEVQANVVVVGKGNREIYLITNWQDENLADVEYRASEWNRKRLLVYSMRLVAKTKTMTTADRTVSFEWWGAHVKPIYPNI